MEIAITPASNLRSPDADPVTGRWLVFGTLMTECFRPSARPFSLHPKEARLLRLVGRLHRLHRLLVCFTRPLSVASGTSPTDAATRLEILTPGGFHRWSRPVRSGQAPR